MSSSSIPERAGRAGTLRLWAGLVALAGIMALVTWVVLRPQAAETAIASPGSTGTPGATFPAVAPLAALRGPAPAFSLPRLGRPGRLSLAAYAGRPVILNFFASWCPDCRQELGAFASVARASHGVAFIGLDTNDTTGSALGLLRQDHVGYPVAVASAGFASGTYLTSELPTTLFLNARHDVVGERYGAQTAATLRSWVVRLGGRV
jgi:thiol-disulfide isomerase/thioredoxin